MRTLIGVLTACCLVGTAKAEDWIPPYVIPPEAVAQEYMVGRLVMVAPSGESPDKKTATVLATVPQGPLMTCMLKLERTETDPMKINGVQWRISSVTCPGTEPPR